MFPSSSSVLFGLFDPVPSSSRRRWRSDTPMQRSMRWARYRSRVTSVRFWLMMLSSCSFLFFIIYFIHAYQVPGMLFHHQTPPAAYWESNPMRNNNSGQQPAFSRAKLFPGPLLWRDPMQHAPVEQQPYPDDNSSNDDETQQNSNHRFRLFGGGDEESSQNDHDDDPPQKDDADSNDAKNPNLYGWTPDIYPNPLVNPMRCSIAYLQPPDGYNNNNSTTEGGDHHHNVSSNRLRLCDPDWVLGGAFLEEIAMAMYNFSAVFGQDRPTELATWDVKVGPSDRRRNLRLETTLEELSPQLSRVLWSKEREIDASSSKDHEEVILPKVELAIATVRKMNLPLVLREGSYFAYEDADDMVNDAAQVFSRALHDSWWRSTLCTPRPPSPSETDSTDSSNDSTQCTNTDGASHGILIFLSIQDHVCFISTGSAISSILPWWRLDNIVGAMRPELRHHDYGGALLNAMQGLSNMLENGPPTLSDRLHDFIARFGVVIAFAIFTFVFGAWGEYRDRRKRWQYADQRSKLTAVEWEKARQLQRDFKTKSCPICLEPFPGVDEEETVPVKESSKTQSTSAEKRGDATMFGGTLKRVDTYGVPLNGADGNRIKLLRCGHIFCDTCWNSWVHSGSGNPCNCPMCRQDVGKFPRKRRNRTAPAFTGEEVVTRASEQSGANTIGQYATGYDALSMLQQPPVALFRGTALLVGNRPPRQRRVPGTGSTETNSLLVDETEDGSSRSGGSATLIEVDTIQV